MSRYDRGGPTRLYVGRISSRTRSRDLEDLFAKYGRVRDVDLKHDFAFVEYNDPRDAEDAVHYLDGTKFDGGRIAVEFARPLRAAGGQGRGGGPGGPREYLGRGPPPGTGRCYNCGKDGHWARDCKAGDWRDKCYRCGRNGHIERNCRNSPRPEYIKERGYASRSTSRSPRRRSYSRSVSRSRSYSRSPVADRRDRDRSPVDDRQDRSRSPLDDVKRRDDDVDDVRKERDRDYEDDDKPAHRTYDDDEDDLPKKSRDLKEDNEDAERGADVAGDDLADAAKPPPLDMNEDAIGDDRVEEGTLGKAEDEDADRDA